MLKPLACWCCEPLSLQQTLTILRPGRPGSHLSTLGAGPAIATYATSCHQCYLNRT